MCNCGNKRNAFTAPLPAGQASTATFKRQPPKMWPDISFQYTGNTGLTVKGTVTGRSYRYNKPGETVPIDYRDVPGMMKIPMLKKME